MLLRFTNVSKQYPAANGADPVCAIDRLNLQLAPGDFVAIRGPSGCGKSTLLLAAGTLLRPDAGSIEIDNADPYALSPEQRARFRARTIGFVFQMFHLVPYLNVRDNVLAAALAGDITPSHARQRALQLLDELGMADRLRHVPASLSTGERQRVALARALLAQPRLLLADEPTGNLDTQNASRVLDHLAAFAESGGAVLLVTHDPRAAERAHKVLDMDRGRIL